MPRWTPDARDRLLAAATALFGAQGVPATSMGQVARAAGMSRSTLHRHVADKPALLAAVRAPILVDVQAAVAEAPAGVTPLDLVEAGLLAVVTADSGADPAARRVLALAEGGPEDRDELGAALITAMTSRGVDPQVATVAAMTGSLALERAAGTGGADTEDRLRDELDALRDACGALV